MANLKYSRSAEQHFFKGLISAHGALDSKRVLEHADLFEKLTNDSQRPLNERGKLFKKFKYLNNAGQDKCTASVEKYAADNKASRLRCRASRKI
uniref:Uncharacterized protein n=1 Tax=Romanomermis culicivorax TaxID=13658 RepID=A0A915KLR5_ROMCU